MNLDQMCRVVSEFDAQGWHRTGTEVDRVSGAWLAGHATALGGSPSLEEYPFHRVEVDTACVEIGDLRLPGLPAFDGGFTGPDGVSGLLGQEGGVLCLAAAPGGPAGDLDAARRNKRWRAIVVSTAGTVTGLGPRNSTSFTRPYGPPMVQISGEYAQALAKAATDGTPVRVVAAARRTATRAANVVATINGRDPSLAPVVVMTPRSSWWNSTSERGGGLVCWLAAMEAAVNAQPLRTVIFTANTGHELGHWGLNQFLDARPGLAVDAHAWIHLGASIGAAMNPRVVLFFSNDEDEQLVVQALVAQGIDGFVVTPRGTPPPGEAKEIHESGGRYCSQAGGSSVFHLEADRWPASVNMDRIERYAKAYAEITLAFANQSA